ncbi:MAG: hypothetical protein QMB55_08030 [Propionivibrio sp.]
MSWRNNAIRFRASLLLMAGVMFVGAVYLWGSSPALPEAVFARHDARVPMSGKAVRVQTARGGGEIRLELEGGEKGRTDCLAMSFVCEGEGAVIYAVAGEVLPLEHGFVWPVSVVRQGRAELSPGESRLAYEQYYERESTRYRLPLAIAFALLGLAWWVGRYTENDPEND